MTPNNPLPAPLDLDAQTIGDYLRYWTQERGMVHDHPTFCRAVSVALGLLDEIANGHDPEVEEGVEHWEWGNYDDSYHYGQDVATNRAAAKVLATLNAPLAASPIDEPPAPRAKEGGAPE